jgi:hypothetical protein
MECYCALRGHRGLENRVNIILWRPAIMLNIPRTVALLSALPLFTAACARPDRQRGLDLAQDRSDWANRREAAEILSHFRDPEAARVLRVLAGDSDRDVRGYAIRTLGERRDRQSTGLFLRALSDDRLWKYCERVWLVGCALHAELISETANQALERTTGHHLKVFSPSRDRRSMVAEWRSFLGSHGYTLDTSAATRPLEP